ncbi:MULTISPECIES: RNA polymerase sigma-70 factor [Flavobacteriaceae]|uniref:RNA polymerase sigma-70 factor n=1 Tax=Flavobacteriaceae TaxID=49546 RepID=UPI001491DE83|nr:MULTISPECIES: RNA polymerase sigma-70 factor [Allomuricauda]MDC6367794.1 RNA polymerase sigma-70 factor [Muricauda sp. AC10]
MTGQISIDNKIVLSSIFDKYYKLLVVFATRFMVSIDDSEDLVQEVFLNLWKDKGSFHNENGLRSFLYTAVKNKCLNHIKHQKIKKNHSEKLLAEAENSTHLDELKHNLEVSYTLHKAVHLLPERKKQVIVYMINGLRNQEIADRMQIKLQTVKTLKSQAYGELRRILNET